MKYPLSIVVILFQVCTSSVIAQTSNSSVTPAVTTVINLTDDIETQSKRWNLSEQEYEYYLDLMRGPLGKWNPDLDPLLALGMFADNPQKERRYAELYAQQEFDFTERTLKFQQAYRDAFERLYANVSISDQQLLSPYFQHEQQKSLAQDAMHTTQNYFEQGDRLMLFVPTDCRQCVELINHLGMLLAYQNETGVDVYVLGATDDDAVRQWVRNHNIGADGFQNQDLTLNRDEGLLQRLLSQSTLPSAESLPIFLKRNGQFFQLNRESLAL